MITLNIKFLRLCSFTFYLSGNVLGCDDRIDLSFEYTWSRAVSMCACGVAGWSASEILDKVDNPSGIPEAPDSQDIAGLILGFGILIWQYWPEITRYIYIKRIPPSRG